MAPKMTLKLKSAVGVNSQLGKISKKEYSRQKEKHVFRPKAREQGEFKELKEV